jgi:hypothetical protein
LSLAISSPTARPLVHTPMDRDGKAINLVRSTVYLEFSLHMLGTSRKVPECLWADLGIVGPAESEEQHDEQVDKKLIKVSKELFDSETLSEIRSFDGHLRNWVRNKCLPFKRGTHFLALGLVPLVEKELVRRRAKRQLLVDKFLAEYPGLCRNIEKRLTAKYYNPTDYPSLEEVAACFRMNWDYYEFGVPKRLIKADPKVFEAARDREFARLRQSVSHIEEIMTAETLKLVSKLRDALSTGADGRKRALRDATFTNLADFLAFFDHRNPTDHKELKAIVDELRSKLGSTDVEEVRNTDALRQRLSTEMSAIADQLTSMVERVPRRKITLH